MSAVEPVQAEQESVEVDVESNGAWRRIGEILIEEGATTSEVLKSALKQQRRNYRPIGEVFVQLGVPSQRVTDALARQGGVAPIDLDSTEIELAAVDTVDAPFARKSGILPYKIGKDGKLHVATTNPGNTELGRQLVELTGRSVRLEFADADAIRRAVDRHYTILGQVGEAAERAVFGGVEERSVEIVPLDPDAPVVQIVNLLITQGLRDRASDIHIEPQNDRLRIRYRIDGALRDVQSLAVRLGPPVASRLKIMADMDIVDRHRAQDGQTSVNVDGRTIDIRIATMETVWGEKVVLRLLDRSRSLMPLAQLGLRAEEHALLRHLIASPYGLFMVSGPTGSGKTTTLYAALNELDRAVSNITTIEDPVEYHFDNINQVQTNRLAGMTFANGLRAILRQDPDVILVGEVRDVETAQIAVQSALTGHLVMASLHSADAVGAMYRFLDMGLESYLIASSVIGVVAQRLVRVNCTKCAVETPVTAEEASFYSLVSGRDPAKFQITGEGCRHCGGTGFFERTGVFECLSVTEEVRDMMVARATQEAIREHAKQNGMRTLQDAVCQLVDEGRTTLAEAMRTVYVL